GRIGPRAFVLLLVLTLLGQFSISTEVFATMTFFGGIALLLGLLFATGMVRRELWSTTLLIGAAYLIVLVITSPYLIQVIRNRPVACVRPRGQISVHLLS